MVNSMKSNIDHAYEYISSRISYNPETGSLTWLSRSGDDHGTKVFNARYAGKECGRIGNHGYIRITIKVNGANHYVSAHRAAWFCMYGRCPDGEIDHINGVKTDNRISNLRDVTGSTNQRNRRMCATNTSGVTGVHWCKRKSKWRAEVWTKRKQNYLGMFDSIDDAAAAVLSFREKNGFTDRHGKIS